MAIRVILGILIALLGGMHIWSYATLRRSQNRDGQTTHPQTYLIADRALTLSIGIILVVCGTLILICVVPLTNVYLGIIFLCSGIGSTYEYFRKYPFRWTHEFVEDITLEDYWRARDKWYAGSAAAATIIVGVILLASATWGH
jgi:hypothetical protein